MKIDRLIGILTVLLQQDQVTAPYLAEKFEVSKRTINRDIEDLCKAGIPLVTTPGRNGGIAIMEGYKIDRTIFTSQEIQAIFTGLKSLDSISENNKYQQLMDKLSVEQSAMLASNNHIMIDLSSWYKSSLAPKIELLQMAIGAKERVRFDYCSPTGEMARVIEPYILVFQWSSWYIWGYCLERNAFRLFKLNRMTKLQKTLDRFEAREIQAFQKESKRNQVHFTVKARFDPANKWRLIEEYGQESFKVDSDGFLLFEFGFYDKNSVIEWILSFGNQVELLEPEEVRNELKEQIDKIRRIYKT